MKVRCRLEVPRWGVQRGGSIAVSHHGERGLRGEALKVSQIFTSAGGVRLQRHAEVGWCSPTVTYSSGQSCWLVN